MKHSFLEKDHFHKMVLVCCFLPVLGVLVGLVCMQPHFWHPNLQRWLQVAHQECVDASEFAFGPLFM